MLLFFVLILLLAVAWGLADHQLNAPIQPPPVPVRIEKPVAQKPVDAVPGVLDEKTGADAGKPTNSAGMEPDGAVVPVPPTKPSESI